MTRRAWLQAALSAVGAPQRGEPEFARRIFDKANEVRVAGGVPALVRSEAVARCAAEQGRRKEALRFPGHNDPERGDVGRRLLSGGIDFARCAENLFAMRGYDDPVNFAIVFWWYSPGHRANMLNAAYTHSGVAVAEGADSMFFATQIFVAWKSN